MKYSKIKEIAKKLRCNPTPSESLLWKYLRCDKMGGYRFLKQHPIIYESAKKEHFFFIPDFYCASAKLIIELDGRIHDYQKDRDYHRDEILQGRGLRILRIRNDELSNIERVLTKIKKELLSKPIVSDFPAKKNDDCF